MSRFLYVLFLMITTTSLSAKQFYSQFKQDQYVYENFFTGKTDGVFVDIGAHDGISLSNTKFFEELGWTGICVEPLPEVFERLKANRSAVCIKGCVSNTTGIDYFFRCEGYVEMLSGLYHKYPPEHLERIEREIKLYGGDYQVIQVDVYLLNDLLAENRITHIDYLTIDTEGNELEILESIDFTRYDIDVIDVENNYNDQRLFDFLASKGYQHVVSLGCDEIFKKQSSLSGN